MGQALEAISFQKEPQGSHWRQIIEYVKRNSSNTNENKLVYDMKKVLEKAKERELITEQSCRYKLTYHVAVKLSERILNVCQWEEITSPLEDVEAGGNLQEKRDNLVVEAKLIHIEEEFVDVKEE